MHFDVTLRDSVGSTNDEIWNLARAGAPAGVCVAAFEQHTGRGTFQRVWVSPQGGLYFSFLLRPHTPVDCWPQISPLLAEAMAGVIRDVCEVGPDVVWVKPKNDVVCDQGKLCGISLEARDGCLNIGCGSNVFHPAGGITTDGRNTAVTLCDLCELEVIARNVGVRCDSDVRCGMGERCDMGEQSGMGVRRGVDALCDVDADRKARSADAPVIAGEADIEGASFTPLSEVPVAGLNNFQRAVLKALLMRYLHAFSLLFDAHTEIV